MTHAGDGRVTHDGDDGGMTRRAPGYAIDGRATDGAMTVDRRSESWLVIWVCNSLVITSKPSDDESSIATYAPNLMHSHR